MFIYYLVGAHGPTINLNNNNELDTQPRSPSVTLSPGKKFRRT